MYIVCKFSAKESVSGVATLYFYLLSNQYRRWQSSRNWALIQVLGYQCNVLSLTPHFSPNGVCWCIICCSSYQLWWQLPIVSPPLQFYVAPLIIQASGYSLSYLGGRVGWRVLGVFSHQPERQVRWPLNYNNNWIQEASIMEDPTLQIYHQTMSRYNGPDQ